MGAFFPPPPPPYAVVITHDIGGFVNQYEEAVARYNLEGRRVEIRGQCRSACTLALAVNNVCVGPGAVVAWHEAYEEFSRRIRHDVTERMLSSLPYAIKAHLDGKIKTSYTEAATLNYYQLLSLGIADCNNLPAPTKSVRADVRYNKTNIAPPAQPNVIEQKLSEWSQYFNWAENESRRQFGKTNTRKYRYKSGAVSTNIYYEDKSGNYVTAAEYSLNGEVFERKICREGPTETKTMECTDWMTNEKTRVVLDPATKVYQEARQ